MPMSATLRRSRSASPAARCSPARVAPDDARARCARRWRGDAAGTSSSARTARAARPRAGRLRARRLRRAARRLRRLTRHAPACRRCRRWRCCGARAARAAPHPRARARGRRLLGARPARGDLARVRRRRRRCSRRPPSAAAGAPRPRRSPAPTSLNTAIKFAVRRPRPQLPDLPPLTATPTQLSFPSAHATSSFAAARVYSAAGRAAPRRSTRSPRRSPPRASISACTTPPTCSPGRCSARAIGALAAGRRR